jgi:hypothetical protein
MGKAILVDCSQLSKTVGQGHLQNMPFLSTGKINRSPSYRNVLAFISVFILLSHLMQHNQNFFS